MIIIESYTVLKHTYEYHIKLLPSSFCEMPLNSKSQDNVCVFVCYVVGSALGLQLGSRLTIAAVRGLLLEQSGTTGSPSSSGLRGVAFTTFPSCFYQLFFWFVRWPHFPPVWCCPVFTSLTSAKKFLCTFSLFCICYFRFLSNSFFWFCFIVIIMQKSFLSSDW